MSIERKDSLEVAIRQHQRAHRPAIGGESAVPIGECGADVCREWVEAYPELRSPRRERPVGEAR